MADRVFLDHRGGPLLSNLSAVCHSERSRCRRDPCDHDHERPDRERDQGELPVDEHGHDEDPRMNIESPASSGNTASARSRRFEASPLDSIGGLADVTAVVIGKREALDVQETACTETGSGAAPRVGPEHQSRELDELAENAKATNISATVIRRPVSESSRPPGARRRGSPAEGVSR
jgi:hypothetical protein